MITDDVKNAREMFIAISIIEHHVSPLSQFSTYDLCESFAKSWKVVEKQAKEKRITFEMSSVMRINNNGSLPFCVESLAR